MLNIMPLVRLSDTIFSDMDRTRPEGSEIFPNLRILVVDKDISQCMLFAHPDVTTFKLYVRHTQETEAWYSELFPQIAHKMPNLTELFVEIGTPAPALIVEDLTVGLLNALPKLRAVSIPPRFTTKLAECCSQLQNVDSLRCQATTLFSHPTFGTFQNIPFEPAVHAALPALSRLALTVTFKDAVQFIRKLAAPLKMVELTITSPIAETQDTFAVLILAAAERLTSLYLLSLQSPQDYLTPRNQDNFNECITMGTFKPLLFLHLRSLNLTHGHPLRLEIKDLEDIAVAWPEIESLNLNPMPACSSRSNLTLEALRPFAKHSHKLRYLGLFVDTSTTYANIFIDSPRFRELEMLALSLSEIYNPPLVAMALSHVCPPYCQISPPFELGLTERGFRIMLQGRQKLWHEVDRLTPYFIQTRMQEQSKPRKGTI